MEAIEETFVEKYDLFACIQCGKCTGGCPVSLKSPLNIRRLIYETLLFPELEEVDGLKGLWDCTTCRTCMDRCPKGVKPMELIIGMRGLLVEEGRIETTIRDALESVFKHGNPWGRIRDKRSDWAEGLPVRNIAEVDGVVDVLYFVCCTAAYDPRVSEVARAMVRSFNAAGVDFATLGNEENCCGSEVRRMGEEGLFEMLVENNTNLFKDLSFNRMVTTSPHCFNAFKNEYGDLGFEVLHYTQFVKELIDQGRLTFSKGIDQVVVYHDPCFLGKQNGIFDEPRQILSSIPGLQLVEFDRCRERSLCCEGGGGRMWIEATGGGERLAEIRVRDAAELGAQVIAVACPFCLLTLEDAVKTTGLEEKLVVKDIMELVAEAL